MKKKFIYFFIRKKKSLLVEGIYSDVDKIMGPLKLDKDANVSFLAYALTNLTAVIA